MRELAHYKMFINGQWKDSESNKRFESINPSSGEPWASIPEASANDVDNAVKCAYEAFSSQLSFYASVWHLNLIMAHQIKRP